MSHDSQYLNYLHYYEKQQRGGNAVFRGARRWQKGDGFGDILRGLFRWFMPVLAQGASTFITETAAGHKSGQSLSDAAKGALKPALGSAVGAAIKRAQAGGGNDHSATAYKKLKETDSNSFDPFSEFSKKHPSKKHKKSKPEKHKAQKNNHFDKQPLKYNF